MVSHAIIQGYSQGVLSFFFFSKAKRSFNNYLRGHEEVGGQLKVHGGHVNKGIEDSIWNIRGFPLEGGK